MVIGARALAGEEERRTMGLLLATPISRSTVVWEKALAMVVLTAAVGFTTFAGTTLGSVFGGLGMSVANIAAACLLLTLLGLVFGAFALALGAGTGRVKMAVSGTAGVALALFLLNAFLPLNDSLAGFARWTPFYYYDAGEPLVHGMRWGHGALLAGLAAGLLASSAVLFERRDLRRTG